MLHRPVQDHPSDDELIQLICDGDESALDTVIDLYGGQVNALCRRICGDELEASGVVSEVFWELWRNASRFRSKRGSLRTYLMTMARSRSLDRYRRETSLQRQQNRYIESTKSSPEKFACADMPDELPIQQEEANEVQSALKSLPPLQRQTLLLAFFDGLSHREVSDRTGLPLGSVKTHIRSGLLKLKHLLAGFRETQEYS